MIGGMRSKDQRVVEDADADAEPSAISQAGDDHRILRVHDLHRHGAGQRHGRRDRQVDIARPERDDEHLADATITEKVAKVSAAVSTSSPPWPPVKAIVASQIASAPR